MGAHLRWKFVDPATGEEWVHPVNPNTMSSPHPPRNIQSSVTLAGRPVVTEGPVAPWEWTFGGEILTGEHYAGLLKWSKKRGPCHVHDHYGRIHTVLFVHYNPEPKRSLGRYWRNIYTMRVMVMALATAPTVGEVSA